MGVLLAAGNVYTGLKISFIDGGSIMAALLSFALFATLRRFAIRPFGPLENNITQTVASSAAIAGFFVGLAGPIPAFELMGTRFPGWAVAVQGAAIGVLGVFAGSLLRRKLIVQDRLPFPTGSATGEIIETMHAARETAIRRARLLIITGAVAMAVTWFRDARPAVIPQMIGIGGTLAGVATAALTIGISPSPLMLSVGALVGLRAAASMLLGGTLAWAVFAPWLLRNGIVKEPSFGAFATWLVWPALGLLVAGSFLPLLLDWRTLVRSLRDVAGLLTRKRPKTGAVTDIGGVAGLTEATDSPTGADAPAAPSRVLPALGIAGLVAVVVVGRAAFGVPVAVSVLALGLGFVLAIVAGRATGETDIAPAGQMGMLTQLAFASKGAALSLLTGWVSTGIATQTSQTLWALKAGQRVGGRPRAQVAAQILGALVGAAVVVPVYMMIIKAYGVGTQMMPATGALSWRATAEAVRFGTSALPPHGPAAGLIGLGVGVALILLGRTRVARFMPTPGAMGMAMMLPVSTSAAACAGALVIVLARRARPSLDDSSVMAVAAGGIAGESIMGVLIAALITTGLL